MTEYSVVQLDRRGNELLADGVLLHGLPDPRIWRARRTVRRQPEQTQPLLDARWCHALGTLPGLMRRMVGTAEMLVTLTRAPGVPT